MHLYEYYLIVLLFITVFISSYTDVRYGKIKNKIMLTAIVLSVPIQLIACLKGEQQLLFYLVNMLCTVVCTFGLYILGVWAAGDCKLLITIAAIVPHNAYWNTELKWFNALSLILMIVSVTYAYILLDTVINCLVNRKVLALTVKKTVDKESIIAFIKRWLILLLVANIISVINFNFLHWSYIIIVLINFVVYMFINKLLHKFLSVWIVAFILNVVYWIICNDLKSISINITIACVSFIIGRAIQVFNYKIIPTNKLQQGMVLSAVSIKAIIKEERLKFLNDKIGETMNDKLTGEEVDLIKKMDIDFLRIVRKIPFALFVAISVIIYFTVEIYLCSQG